MINTLLTELSPADRVVSDQLALILVLGIWPIPVLEAFIDSHNQSVQSQLSSMEAVLDPTRWSMCVECVESCSQDIAKLFRWGPVGRHKQLAFDTTRAAVY